VDDVTDGRRELIGVVCTDLKLPEWNIAESIANSPFFDVFVATVPARASLEMRDLDVAHVPPPRGLADFQKHLPISRLKTALLAQLTEGKLPTNAVSRFAVEDERTGEPAHVYFLPLAGADDQPARALLITPTTPWSVFVVAPRVLALVIGLLSAFLAATSVAKANKASAHARRLTVLRNLPVGVMEVDGFENVVVANDRAEEVLRCELPKTDDDPVETKNFRSDLIEDLIVRPVGRGGFNDRAERYDDVIPAARKRDEWSSYYACLRGTAHWVRVTAVPVLAEGSGSRRQRERREGVPVTFGIVEPASPADSMRLHDIAKGSGAPWAIGLPTDRVPDDRGTVDA
jgi:hypothetical protein